jgi:muramoyltetrapeptide carboxypeptidase LdcA involved in peptidoglycan recycling
MSEMIKPAKLHKGDVIGIISPSWGGPSILPHIYENGLKNLKSLGFSVKEFPTARGDAKYQYQNPKVRAEDVNAAFADQEVKGIITSIGGDDAVRILPYLDKEVIAKNPKFFMGYSDTTILTTFCNKLGIVTFNGPSIMAGFSQMEAEGKQFRKHLEEFMFGDFIEFEYQPYDNYFNNYPDWSDQANTGKVSQARKNNGWRWLQGTSTVRGELLGGNIEVLEFIKGTDYWFTKDFWNGKILFFETSEDKPTVNQVMYMLRNYGMQGIFDRVSAVLFGRARDYSIEEKKELDITLINVIGSEFGRRELPIVSNMDFGHTDPQVILPLGIKAEVNTSEKSFKLLESPFR